MRRSVKYWLGSNILALAVKMTDLLDVCIIYVTLVKYVNFGGRYVL